MASGKKEYSLGFIIGAQLKSTFSNTFKKVKAQIDAAKKAAQDCGKAWANFGQSAARLGIGAAAAGASIATAVWKMTDSVAENAQAIEHNAARLGMSSEEFQKLQYAFESAGVSSEDFLGMMTDLDNKVVQLASDGKAAKAWGKEFGLDMKKLAGLSPEKRIERLVDYLNQLEDPLERDRLALELFGSSNAKVQSLIEMGSAGIQEAGDRFMRTGNLITDATLEQADAYTEMKQELTSTVSGIKTQLTSGLLPAFTGVFGDITARLQGINWAAWGEKIAGWVQETIPKVREMATVVSGFLGKIWDGIQTVKDFVGGWENVAKIIAGLMAAKTAILGIVAAVKTISMVVKVASALTNPWVLIIGAVIAAIILLVQNWDTVKEVVMNVARSIADSWNTNMERIRAVLQAIGDFFVELWEGIKAFFVGLWEGIVAAFAAAFDLIKGVAQGWWDWFIGVLASIGDFFTTLWDNLKAVFEAFVEFFVNLFTGNWEALGENIKAIWEGIKATVSGVFDGLLNTVKSWVDGILGFFKPITDFFSGIGSTIASIFGGKKTLEVDVQTSGASLPGHGAGGIFTRPHAAFIAEDGDTEAVVPINNKPASRGIWETAGRMAGFTQNSHSEQMSVSVPVSVQVAGSADAGTVKGINAAASNIAAQVRAAVRAAVLAEMAAMQRQKARLAY